MKQWESSGLGKTIKLYTLYTVDNSTLPAIGLAAVMAVFVVRRILLEDRFVMAALPGYADYAARVRYRLFPGVW